MAMKNFSKNFSKDFKLNKLDRSVDNLQDLIYILSPNDLSESSENQKELVKALLELDNLIGLDSLKQELINQILYFIKNLIKDGTFLHTVITGPPGTGKCMSYNTPIIMYDGSIKMIQDIKVGDLLMGDDSTCRNVLSICKGKEPMYKIKQLNGDDYIVNESHILSLKISCSIFINHKKYQKGDIIDISVKDYLKLSNNVKSKLKGYKVPINFQFKKVQIDPYIIGLGLESLIPNEYKYNSRENQLKLLAGILDSVGTYNNDNDIHCYNIIQKNYLIAKDIEFIARCLGLTSTVVKCTSNVSNFQDQIIDIDIDIDTYYKQTISGNIEEIPCILKKVSKNGRKYQIKNNLYTLHTQIKVEPVDENYYKQGSEYEYYYGFEIDGNRRFLLGDHTVTHNTTVINILAKIYKAMGFLTKDTVIKVDRSDLIAEFLGQTAIKTKKVLEKAKGWYFINR